MVGRGHGGFVAQADDELGFVFTEFDGEFYAGLEGIEQPAVGEVQKRADVYAESFAGGFGFGHSHIGPGREGRGFPIGEVNDSDLVTGVDKGGERAATGDFDVVGVGADGHHVELLMRHVAHGPSLANRRAKGKSAGG